MKFPARVTSALNINCAARHFVSQDVPCQWRKPVGHSPGFGSVNRCKLISPGCSSCASRAGSLSWDAAKWDWVEPAFATPAAFPASPWYADLIIVHLLHSLTPGRPAPSYARRAPAHPYLVFVCTFVRTRCGPACSHFSVKSMHRCSVLNAGLCCFQRDLRRQRQKKTAMNDLRRLVVDHRHTQLRPLCMKCSDVTISTVTECHSVKCWQSSHWYRSVVLKIVRPTAPPGVIRKDGCADCISQPYQPVCFTRKQRTDFDHTCSGLSWQSAWLNISFGVVSQGQTEFPPAQSVT